VTNVGFSAEGRPPKGFQRKLLQAMGCLLGIMTVAWVADVLIVVRQFASDKAVVAGIAAAVCALSSGMALVVSFFGAWGQRAVAGALGGIAFRTGLPLTVMAVGSLVPWLSANEFGGRIVVYFLISLAAETILAVWLARHSWNIRFWR